MTSQVAEHLSEEVVQTSTTSSEVVTAQRRTIRRQRLWLGFALAATITSVGGLVASSFIKSPAQQAAETGPPRPSLTTAAARRDVLKSTIVTRGTVAASSQFRITPTVSTQGASNLLLTAVRTSQGSPLTPGSVPLEISGRPLIALQGTQPTYRDLKPGDHGNDVAELQDALSALGDYAGGDPHGQLGSATKKAIQKLYEHLGYDVPTTGGPDDRGDVAALHAAQAAVTTAQRAVNDLQLQIGAHQEAGPGQEPFGVQMQYLKQTLREATQAQSDLIAHTGPMLPEAEAFFLPTFPSYVAQFSAKVGATVAAPLLIVSSGALAVTADMSPDDGGLLKAGMSVQIASETLNLTADATVTSVGALATDNQSASSVNDPSEGGSDQSHSGPYIPVTITPSIPLAATWNQQNVRLTITQAATPDAVLIVPVSAVSEAADGSVTVTKVVHGAATSVPVTTGLSGNGYIEIKPTTPDSVQPGDQVVVSDTQGSPQGGGS